jgi:hypothetical protein
MKTTTTTTTTRNRNFVSMSYVVIPLVMVLLFSNCLSVKAYVPQEIKQRWKDTGFRAEQAFALIDKCAEAGQDEEELFWAVKFLDRFANSDIYDDMDKRKALMDRANGSWELRLACNSDRDEYFYPHPEFRNFANAFSSVGDDYVGKGISTRDNGFCFVSLAGPSTRDIKRRIVYMNYEDYFINGNQVPGWDLSYYLRGYQRGIAGEREKPKLSFTVIAASDKSMVVRGSKTGGFAIFRKIDDMSRIAFGM